jgi:phosphomannomutase
MQVTASNFKAYDIRGVVGKTIDEAFAEHLGRAFGSEARRLGERAVAVGRDGRLSGPGLTRALIKGRAATTPRTTTASRWCWPAARSTARTSRRCAVASRPRTT